MDHEARITEFVAEFVAEAGRHAGDDPADPRDLDAVGAVLVELAGDQALLQPLVDELASDRFDARSLHGGESGLQLLLVHRPEGVMSYTHSHAVWVAFAAVEGVETHQQYEVAGESDGHADLRLLDERRLRPGDVATMTPPRDIHSHGHVEGSGPTPYSLVLLGDNQLRYERREYDLETGAARVLLPGDFGTLDRPR